MTAPLPFGARVQAWSRRPEVRGVFLIWLVLTALLCLFSVVPARIMGPPASPTKVAVENTMTLFTLLSAPVAAFVWAIAIYSLIRWRHRGPQPPAEDGPAIRGNGPASGLWVVISCLLCLFLLIWGFVEIQAVSASAATSNPLVVDVTGQQWVWSFSYPNEGDVESDQLYLPVNRPVVFHVTSKDVVHSFWVVQMGIKVDANPGQTTETTVTPDRIGRFDIRCAELCGLLHADMETSVHVVDASDFQSFLRSHSGNG